MAQSLKHMFEMGGERKPPFGSAMTPESLNNDGLASFINTIGKLTSALQAARTEGSRTYNELGRSAQGWSDLATKATGRVLALLTEHQQRQTSSVTAHARAEQAKSLATASALKHTAFYKAIAATASGFQALGNFDFWAAAQDFTAAALFGTLAGAQVASMGGSAGRGPGDRGASRSAYRGARGGGGHGDESSAGVAISALGAGSASAAHPPSGHLTVAIMGDNQAGEWLANTLNTAVEQRGVQLTSTRSTRSAYAQG